MKSNSAETINSPDTIEMYCDCAFLINFPGVSEVFRKNKKGCVIIPDDIIFSQMITLALDDNIAS